MIPLMSPLRNQRGSALLISLVLIAVITILGLALFELGQIEGQQSLASLDDARAFELAQAGMERAIRELSNAFLADLPGTESWVDGANKPTCAPACETGVYQTMNLANNTLPFVGVNPLTGQDPGGTFTVELKQVTVAEANNPISQGAGYTYPYGQTCIPSAPTNPTVCANLMFVRSTGTVAAPPLATGPPLRPATRTVQALVKAYSTSYFAGGLTAEKSNGGNDPAVDGRVLIAGSVQILGSATIDRAFQIDGGAGMGMRNSWSDLWPDIDAAGVRTLARLTPRQAICPTGASCGGGTNLVESLGAELGVYGNTANTMVRLNGGTDLGISTIQTAAAYGDISIGSRFGKGRIDGVYVADGCPFPCTAQAFNFNGGSTVYVDTNNYTKPYPYRPPKLPLKDQLNWIPVLYPTADLGTVINGTSYAIWYSDFMVDHTRTNAALSGGPVLAPDAVSAGELILINPTALPVPLNNAEFARLSSSKANGGYCGDGVLHTTASDYRTSQFLQSVLNNLDDSATDGSQGFCHTFKFMNKAGALTVGEICWRRNVLSPSNLTARGTANLPPNYLTMPTLEFGSPSCAFPTDPSNPLLINYNGQFRFKGTTVGTNYQYRGSAIIYLNQGDLDVEQTLQTTCSVSPCGDDLTTVDTSGNPLHRPQRFPENNLLVFISRGNGNVHIANTGNAATDIVDRFMAYVYTERAVQVRKLTNLIGSLRAQQFCFNNSSGTNGCGGVSAADGNPKFFQAGFQDLRKIPAELPASSGTSGDRWLANIVPRFWIECRRSPDPLYILPTTPTGDCQYQ